MKIGLLLPNSKYYLYIGSDLYNSLKHFLGDSHNYIIKDTLYATPNDNQKAVKELVLYEGVDIIVGFLGYRSITAVKPLIQQTRTPLILCSPGDHPHLSTDDSPYIVHLSLGVYQSIYLACKWAFNNIGKSYSYIGSFFEAGYPILHAADAASKQYEGQINQLTITHKDKDAGIKEAFEKLKQNISDFIFMGYHGFEAMEIAEYLKKNTQFTDIPLVVSPFFADPEILRIDFHNPTISVKTWTNTPNELSEEIDQVFKKKHNRSSSIFAVLGMEAALIIKHCLDAGWSTKEEIARLMPNFTINSPRGTLSFNPTANNFTYNYHLITSNLTKNSELYRFISNKRIIVDPVDEQIMLITDRELSGWTNTYLCN